MENAPYLSIWSIFTKIAPFLGNLFDSFHFDCSKSCTAVDQLKWRGTTLLS